MEVKINEEIIRKFEKRIEKSSEFNSIEEYVNFILSQVADKIESEEKEEEFSKEDEEKVEERLRGLGYLD